MRRLTEEKQCAEALAEFTDQLIAGREPSIDLFLLSYRDIQSRLQPALEAAVFLFEAFEAARRGNLPLQE